jgi:hypothetical protein
MEYSQEQVQKSQAHVACQSKQREEKHDQEEHAAQIKVPDPGIQKEVR